MIRHRLLERYIERYEEIETQPLSVELQLITGSIANDGLHLDSILAKAVVMDATHGAFLPESDEPYLIPLPLRCEWRHPDRGLPLWRSTQFLPLDDNGIDNVYWNKRAPRPEYTRKNPKSGVWNIRTTQGQFKEYLVPIPKNIALRWVAYCDGNAQEIERLLGLLSHVGKKRSQGYGLIWSWNVVPAKSFSFALAGKLLRPIPALFFGRSFEGTIRFGWTPPYWLPACQDECLMTGKAI